MAGCSTDPNEYFGLKKLAKSKTDLVIDVHIDQVNQVAIELLKKLYKRNPRELEKSSSETTAETRIEQLFGFPRQTEFSELGNKFGNSALRLAFAENFEGDRVFAFMAGIAGMLHTSYNYQEEFFMFDSIDHQKIYNSARNLEVASWMLNNKKNDQGGLYILSNSGSGASVSNLSYERLFGKMIASQDILAIIIANKNDRVINTVVHGFASTALLPI